MVGRRSSAREGTAYRARVGNDLGPDRGAVDDTPERTIEPPQEPVGIGPRSGWSWALLVAGAAMIGSAAWAFATGWVGLRGSHPIGWITTALTALVGLAFAARAWTARTARGAPGWRRWAGRATTAVVVVVLVVVVVYTRPFSAEQVALDAVVDGGRVDVSDGATSIEMRPADEAATGVVFYPGAKVDPAPMPVSSARWPRPVTRW